MQLRRFWLGAGAAALALALSGPAAAAEYSPSTILVKFAKPARAIGIVRSLGDRPLGLTLNGVEVVGLDRGESVAKKVARYRALAGVVYAEPNFIAHGQGEVAKVAAPNDPGYGSQWAWGPIRALDAWSVYPGSYSGGNAAIIAIVDTGVDSHHPDLADGRVLTALGANCVTASGACSSGTALDDNGHGTHVAGIAAAATNNAVGVAGTAFGAQVIPVKVLDASANGTYGAITNGILWAARHGARAINLSLGGSSASTTLCDAVTEAIADGAVVVASAGNGSTSAANYPAACAGAVGVAATDSSDKQASFSNFGSPDVFLSAPGVSIYSTYPNASYATMSGTSMAAPFVTGTAALLFGQQPTRSVADVKTILAQTSDKVGSGYGPDPYSTCAGCTWSSAFGYGRLDVYGALTAGSSGLEVNVTPATATMDSTSRSATYMVSVIGTGIVDLSVSGLPGGITGVIAPPELVAPGSARLVVSVPPGTPAGSYMFTVTGKSGSLVSSASATLVVPVSDFTIAISPNMRYSIGGLVALPFEIQLGAQGTFAGLVDLSVAGLPPGAMALFLPPSSPAPGASALTVQLAPLTPPGTYTLTVTGSSGGLAHAASATLVVK
ncbi:MAG: thermitase [Gaiellaceae bacterium]|nr:thermitase [Gaiellaceae bacterium]